MATARRPGTCIWTTWVWEDAGRTDRLCRIYNELFNSSRRRDFSGTHLSLPGINTTVLRGGDLAVHQKDAVWMILQTSSVLLDLCVGAGKTFIMLAAAHELKHLGLARKILITVPNHLTEQWASEANRLYSDMRVLAMSADDFSKERRGTFLSRIATEEQVVCDRGARLRIETDRGDLSARGIINATGTWETPYIPDYPGADRFKGRQLHTRGYRTAEEFAGQHVIIVGGGISAIQLLDEISRVAITTWVTRRPPEFRTGPFTEEHGRAAVALVEDRVRRGLPPTSVVSVTGLPITPAIEAMRERGVLKRRAMFSEILEDGVRWLDGTVLRADVILWCTGFRSSLDHLAPLMLREAGGGITIPADWPHRWQKSHACIWLANGPSASTIGANRAGAAAASELMAYLGLP